MLGIQIVGILFGLFMLYMTFLHKKREEFTSKEGIFWLLVWLAFIFVSFFPRSIDFIVVQVLNMSRPLDFFIIIGFMFLIGLTFYNYTLVRKNQKRLEAVVRKIAIKKAEK